MRPVVLIVLLFFLPLATFAVEADGRAIEIEIDFDRRIWFSDENIIIEVSISGAQYSVSHNLTIILSDSTDILAVQTDSWQQTASRTTKIYQFESFFTGNRYITAEVSFSRAGSELASSEEDFVVLRNSILPNKSNIVVFGDSLSDMGNAKDSILDVPDVPPYWNGRFSNGKVWVEYFSDNMGLNTTHGSGTSPGDNRAFGGSQTGQGYSYLLLPNVGTQIDSYLTNVQTAISNDDLVILWAGGNDFLYGLGDPDVISANMASHITALAGAGATHFLVANLPPLEKTPEVRSWSASRQSNIANDVVEYNQKLNSQVSSLKNDLSIDINLIDAHALFNEIETNAPHLGLTNTIDPACSSSGSILPLPICNSGDSVVENVDAYLYFDKAHPTAALHSAMGEYISSIFGEHDTDGDLVPDTNDQCNWTKNRSVDAQGCSWEQRDDDDDGVVNEDDLCTETSTEEIANDDGCGPTQRDSDQDGLNDAIDPCPEDPIGTDHDGDGCIDVTDDDDDNDGILDSDDACPQGIIGGLNLDTDGDGCTDTEDFDDDGDGLSDSDEAAAGSDPLDADTDGDGYMDGEDDFPTDESEWRDRDSDGFGDNSDAFPNDSSEWNDTDQDSVGDNSDDFPTDPKEWNDLDNDGIGDNSDACPSIPGTSFHPVLGCPDSDGDGWADSHDNFPNNEDEWNDSDGDGVGDNADPFDDDASEWNDLDNDGTGDNSDAFPGNPNEWNDSDGDGYGDNSDVFPLDSKDWVDFDGDGVGDNTDDFPTDPEFSSDRDGDGYADQVDDFPDDPQAIRDSDGDGVADVYDVFPNDASETKDSDGDGVGDSTDPMPLSDRYASSTDIAIDGSLAIISLLLLILILRKLN